VIRFSVWNCARLVFFSCIAAAATLSAQTYTTLADLSGNDGLPHGSLIQGRDGNFYGVSFDGAVFRITPGGEIADSLIFGSPSGILQATDGNLYGTTNSGGDNFVGDVFKLGQSGSYVLYSFTGGSDGYAPEAALVQGKDGGFYGTTSAGANGYGTIFKITPAGILTTRHAFNYSDGAYPVGQLLQGSDGKFYGTTAYGGNLDCVVSEILNGCGVVFKVDSAGNFQVLHEFNSNDGAAPYAGLVQALDGNFYGTTSLGGDPACQCGTVFRISPAGKLSTLYQFHNDDGAYPLGPLIQATDGAFYGTTFGTGILNCTSDNSCGTVFKLTGKDKLTTLHSFCLQQGCPDGVWPHGGLLQSTNGLIYGTASEGGGPCDCGTVFSLDVNLKPFVTFVNASGKVGTPVGILGQGFTGASAVSFNGTAANFKVVSDTFLKTAVPPGASSGPVTVSTPSGTLTSNIPFRVRK